MNDISLSELNVAFKKCSDWLLHPDYVYLLNKLCDIELSQEHIDYLCNIVTSKNHTWEVRFEHLRVLLLNPSAKLFDLKNFYFERLKRSRRLAMKIFFIRGYATYASEEELNSVMNKFCKNLESNHDYADYEYVLSIAGLPYLLNTYGYNCFAITLERAKEEYQNIDPLLRGFFTLNSKLEQIQLLSHEETHKRTLQFFENHRNMH